MISLFTMASKYSAKALSSVPKPSKPMMCRVLNRLHLGMRDSAVGSVSGKVSTIYIKYGV